MFTRQLLKSLATATVFQRGQAYYEDGEVGRVKRQDDTFTAKVRGSYTYQVKLVLRPAGPELSCNCPYDFEGICKHLVAFGLAVLDEFGPELQPTATAAEPATDTPALDALLSITGTARQLKFLHELLRRNGEVARQFVQFITSETATASAENQTAAETPETVELSLEAVSTEVYEVLSDLVFDEELLTQPPDYHSYHHQDDYYGEGDEEMLARADEAIDEVLRPYAAALAADVRTGRLVAALQRWVGVHEGIEAATEPEADDYDLFSYDGYPAHVQQCWARLLTEAEVFRRLETTPFAPAETDAALAVLFARPGVAAPLADGRHCVGAAFQELLRSLALDTSTAARLRPHLEPPADLDTARILLQVARTLADDDLWLRTATQFAEADFTLATELLEHHRQQPGQPGFTALLQQLWPRFGPRLMPYLLLHLRYEDAPELYLAALEMRCCAQRSVADYQELRHHWTPEQRRRFVDAQQPTAHPFGGDALFAAELLAAENRDAELLPLLRRQPWQHANGIGEILALTARTQPHECFDLVMERTEELLQAGIRDRNLYRRIVGWLLVLGNVGELKTSVALLAAHLYTEYSRLHALREELRAAGLVRVVRMGKQYQLIQPNPEADAQRALQQEKQQVTEGAKRGRRGKAS